MCLTMNQFEQACGYLLFNEYNEFVYYCKKCQSEFKSGAFLEAHILSEYHDNKRNIFVNDGIFIGDCVFESTPDENDQQIENNSSFDGNLIENSGEFCEYDENEWYEDEEERNGEEEYENGIANEYFVEGDQQANGIVPFNEFDRNCTNKFNISENAENVPTKKRRGRPPGSKNKKYSNNNNVLINKNGNVTSDSSRNGSISSESEAIDSVLPRNDQQHKNESVKNDKETMIMRLRVRPLASKKRRYSSEYEKFVSKVRVTNSKRSKGRPPKPSFIKKLKDGKCEVKIVLESIENSTELKCPQNAENNPKATVNGVKNETKPESKLKKPPSRLRDRKLLGEGFDPMGIFYCDMCPGETIRTKSNLLHHMKLHALNKIRKRCPLCQKKPRNFEHHMKVSHSAVPYECNFCSAAFKTHTGYVLHVRSHTGERPYLCVQCGLSFAGRGGFRKHEMRVHFKIKSYPCKQCDQSFYSNYQLQDHINGTHSMERPHICNICSKNFSSRSYLRIHRFTHGEKTHQCRHCPKMFKLADNRRLHEKSVHSVI